MKFRVCCSSLVAINTERRYGVSGPARSTRKILPDVRKRVRRAFPDWVIELADGSIGVVGQAKSAPLLVRQAGLASQATVRGL